jgi:DNA-binding LacI/PurR family transcriptional regulator
VPQDVAVVGFDDLREITESTEPPLTTVHQDVEEMGSLMARLLFDRTEHPDAPALSSAVVPTRLVLRKSA